MLPHKHPTVVFFWLTCGIATALGRVGEWYESPPNPNSCNDDNWRVYNDVCYRYYLNESTWEEAHEVCSKEGSHIATVMSQEIDNELCNFVNYESESWRLVWLNAKANSNNHSLWTWMDTGEELNYTNWKIGRPDGSNSNKSCLMMDTVRCDDMRWSDENCDQKNAFLCQRNTTETKQCKSKNPSSVISGDDKWLPVAVSMLVGPAVAGMTVLYLVNNRKLNRKQKRKSKEKQQLEEKLPDQDQEQKEDGSSFYDAMMAALVTSSTNASEASQKKISRKSEQSGDSRKNRMSGTTDNKSGSTNSSGLTDVSGTTDISGTTGVSGQS